MTAPATPHGTQRRTRRRTARLIAAVLLLVLLLAPVVYMFGQLWTAAGSTTRAAGAERAAVAYARPLSRLLAALVDAQSAAVTTTVVDPTGVRAAMDEVNAVDRRSAGVLLVRQRWDRLTHEIDGALGQDTGGPAALRVYATPIALTQALLGWIADSSRATSGAGVASYHLVHVALQRLPDVVSSTGTVSVLAATVQGAVPDPHLTTAVDRLARAAEDVGVGLRAGADAAAGDAVDLRLLRLTDEFAAAADELGQTAAGLDGRNADARERVVTASARVKAAAAALEAAVLDVLDARITADVEESSTRRWTLLLAGALVPLAALALLALRISGSGAPSAGAHGGAGSGETGGHGETAGRHGLPTGGLQGWPDDGQDLPDLVDARRLLTPELVHVGRPMRARKPQKNDDRR